MARTTHIAHNENAETSWLFNGFLALSIGWLVLTALVGGVTVNAANADVGTPVIISE